MRPLGATQRSVLESLVRNGHWHSFFTCGWVWDNASNTTRIMESLVRRGLAQKERKEVSPACNLRDYYTPTQVGIDLVNGS